MPYSNESFKRQITSVEVSQILLSFLAGKRKGFVSIKLGSTSNSPCGVSQQSVKTSQSGFKGSISFLNNYSMTDDQREEIEALMAIYDADFAGRISQFF